MQDVIGEAGKTPQGDRSIEVTQHGNRPAAAPNFCIGRIANQGEDAVAADQPGKGAAGHIPAADDQDFLHRGILADNEGKQMSYRITVTPSGKSFDADPDETVLSAALRQGLVLPYGCRDGACGSCKGKVVCGEIEDGKAKPPALSDADRAAGFTLFCCAFAQSDLTLECKTVRAANDIPVKTLPTRIEKLERLAPDVIELHLRLPAIERMPFLAAQYVVILPEAGNRSSLSLANAPHDDAFLQLHIRHVPGGLFTDQVFSTLKVRDILRINGPHGSFTLREESEKPMVLVAGGTGFAPIKSLVEHAFHEACQRPMVLYWGAKAKTDLYQDDLPLRWAAKHPQFRYVPVLSEARPEDRWNGRSGLVHAAVMADFPDLSGYEVYACGAPAMIEAARRDFTVGCCLPEEAFFSDAFTFSN